jgi:hypothetical protein
VPDSECQATAVPSADQRQPTVITLQISPATCEARNRLVQLRTIIGSLLFRRREQERTCLTIMNSFANDLAALVDGLC